MRTVLADHSLSSMINSGSGEGQYMLEQCIAKNSAGTNVFSASRTAWVVICRARFISGILSVLILTPENFERTKSTEHRQKNNIQPCAWDLSSFALYPPLFKITRSSAKSNQTQAQLVITHSKAMLP